MKTPTFAPVAALLFCTSLLSGGCQLQGEMDMQGDAPEDLPEGAIQAGNTLYMIPVSLDESGCQQYSAHDTNGMTPAVIYYRRADGSFTPDRTEADCSPATK